MRQNCFRDHYLSWPPPKKQFPQCSPKRHPSKLTISIWLRRSVSFRQSQLSLLTHTHPPCSTQDSFFTAQPVSQGSDPSWQGSAVLCCSYSGHTMVYLQWAAACLLSAHSQTWFECNGREQESSHSILYCRENKPKNQWPFFPFVLIFR